MTNDEIMRLKAKWASLGLKLTKQREAICRVFFASHAHRQVEEILRGARLEDPNVSLATVYRTLKLLLETGFARTHNFQEGGALYEPMSHIESHHDHLICTLCGTIVEFVDDKIERQQLLVAKNHGFVITHHTMELYGRCKKCISV